MRGTLPSDRGGAPRGLRRTVAAERAPHLPRGGGRRGPGGPADRPGRPRFLPRRAARDAGEARPGCRRFRSPVRALLHGREGPGGGPRGIAAGRARAGEADRPGARGGGAPALADVAARARPPDRPRRSAGPDPPAGDAEPRFPRPAKPAAARVLRAPPAAGGGIDGRREGAAAIPPDAAGARHRSGRTRAGEPQGLPDAAGIGGGGPPRRRPRAEGARSRVARRQVPPAPEHRLAHRGRGAADALHRPPPGRAAQGAPLAPAQGAAAGKAERAADLAQEPLHRGGAVQAGVSRPPPGAAGDRRAL